MHPTTPSDDPNRRSQEWPFKEGSLALTILVDGETDDLGLPDKIWDSLGHDGAFQRYLQLLEDQFHHAIEAHGLVPTETQTTTSFSGVIGLAGTKVTITVDITCGLEALGKTYGGVLLVVWCRQAQETLDEELFAVDRLRAAMVLHDEQVQIDPSDEVLVGQQITQRLRADLEPQQPDFFGGFGISIIEVGFGPPPGVMFGDPSMTPGFDGFIDGHEVPPPAGPRMKAASGGRGFLGRRRS